MERYRREVESCADIEKMRVLTLDMLKLLEQQRQWFVAEIKREPPFLTN